MRWLVATYYPVSLFSLKHGEATSTGGKTLLVPTPFAVRTALVDAAIRVFGADRGPTAFEHVRALRLALRPPRWAAVSGLFAKILKPERDPARGRPMQSTIAFREYVHLQGELSLAFGGPDEALRFVEPLMPHVTYFGKRGSLFQLARRPHTVETGGDPPAGFVLLVGRPPAEGAPAAPPPSRFTLGIIQRVDDWGETLTFERLNAFSDAPVRMGRDRVRFDVVLPYQVTLAGRGFTVYSLNE